MHLKGASTIAAFLVLLTSSNATSQPTVPPGFEIESIGVIPQPQVLWMDIAVPPCGSPFPDGIYVSVATAWYGKPGPPDDFIYRIATADSVELFLAFPEPETDPTDILFGNGNPFGWDLYVSANNMDNYQPGVPPIT